MSYSDKQLKAYLDGSLEPEIVDAIDQQLSADPELEKRLLALEPLRPVIGAAFETVPNAARLAALDIPAPAQSSAPTRRFFLAGGIAAASGAAGFGIAALSTPPAAPLGWQEQVAIYQALYGPETVEHIDPTPEALDAQFARASAALGRDMQAADVAGLDGLTLRRAQILNFEGRPLVQIVFSAESGEPVAFCILMLAQSKTKAPQFRTLSGLQTSHWMNGDYGYMVLGDVDVALLDDVTGKLSATF